mmetsp:Transcript_85714/g.136075  ORF Transcript_85714/g.136075 Transcript_85714/m.136075 type:complete len:491 (+) Transcript_85714:431-1903(+)
MNESKLPLNAIDVFLGKHRHLHVDMMTCFAGGIEFSNVFPARLGLHQKFHVHLLTLRLDQFEGSHRISIRDELCFVHHVPRSSPWHLASPPAIFRGQLQGTTSVALMTRLVHEQQAFGPGLVTRVMRIDLDIHWSFLPHVPGKGFGINTAETPEREAALTQQQVMLTTQRMDVWIPSTAPLRRCGGCGGNRAKRRVCQQAVHPIIRGSALRRTNLTSLHCARGCAVQSGFIQEHLNNPAGPIIVGTVDATIKEPLGTGCTRIALPSRPWTDTVHFQGDQIGIRQNPRHLLHIHQIAPAADHIFLFAHTKGWTKVKFHRVQISNPRQELSTHHHIVVPRSRDAQSRGGEWRGAAGSQCVERCIGDAEESAALVAKVIVIGLQPVIAIQIQVGSEGILQTAQEAERAVHWHIGSQGPSQLSRFQIRHTDVAIHSDQIVATGALIAVHQVGLRVDSTSIQTSARNIAQGGVHAILQIQSLDLRCASTGITGRG